MTIGQWLAGGAVTITALGARFTETFGKLRVALDAALDIDNYFQDPPNRLPPRARIFSRYASLLADIRKRGYSRVVIVSHSQGTVISADLLRYLVRHSASARLRRHDAAVAGHGGIAAARPVRRAVSVSVSLDGHAADFVRNAAPHAADLQLAQWVNAYRAGDYVGRSIWTAPAEPTMLRVAPRRGTTAT